MLPPKLLPFSCRLIINQKMKNYPRLYAAPLLKPESVQPLLRDPELHWKKGRSAYEAAHSWVNGNLQKEGGLPLLVRATLNVAPEWKNAELVSGFFEHATPLDTNRGPSNSDLLAVCRLESTLGIIAVEAKAGETFGELISVWNTTAGRSARLSWACKLFGVDEEDCGDLRWQLFHRTASAVLEAKRYHAPHAAMLVHDFSAEPGWYDDYAAFAEVIGVKGTSIGTMSDPVVVEGISLRLAWVHEPAAQ
ncbi:DUF6946 family protein [Hyphomonas jannaschiana]|uniref:DUF6946 family protein n=1 Tax=Hyphomonas jannaschiana TaxID=86 RepID=UPI0035C6CAD9